MSAIIRHPRFFMVTCATCDADMDIDGFDVECGDRLSCPECGSNLEVLRLDPVELGLVLEGRETDNEETGEFDVESSGSEDDFD